MPQTGKLDQRVTLQSLAETNNSGQLQQVYSDVATVWAEVIARKADEAFEAARTNARRTIRVRIRYRADVTTKWRLVWQGQAYNIIDPDRSARRDGSLWLTCEAVGTS